MESAEVCKIIVHTAFASGVIMKMLIFLFYLVVVSRIMHIPIYSFYGWSSLNCYSFILIATSALEEKKKTNRTCTRSCEWKKHLLYCALAHSRIRPSLARPPRALSCKIYFPRALFSGNVNTVCLHGRRAICKNDSQFFFQLPLVVFFSLYLWR